MEIIAQESWSWTLFQDGTELYLSVLCGTIGVYEVTLKPEPTEVAADTDRKAIDAFASKVRYEPERFSHRHIANFHKDPAVNRAVAGWQCKRNAT